MSLEKLEFFPIMSEGTNVKTFCGVGILVDLQFAFPDIVGVLN